MGSHATVVGPLCVIVRSVGTMTAFQVAVPVQLDDGRVEACLFAPGRCYPSLPQAFAVGKRIELAITVLSEVGYVTAAPILEEAGRR